jgi:SAM-dependent methyltransferase
MAESQGAKGWVEEQDWRRPARWSLEPLVSNASLRRADFGINDRAKRVRYPTRGLRYWFLQQLLTREAALRGRPLCICDIGVDRGQALDFVRGVPSAMLGDLGASAWDAISRCVDHRALRAVGYNRIVEADVSRDSLGPEAAYDAVIASHILEHLYDPETALDRIASLVADGGVVIGGVPAVPRWLQRPWERRLRRTARPVGARVRVLLAPRASHGGT